jgi:phosphoglycerate-specific signal transduction histidine kinase
VNRTGDAGAQALKTSLRKFLHELSAPLSALALTLETASRAASRGEDPSEALAQARRTLESVFDKFERGRVALLGESDGGAGSTT